MFELVGLPGLRAVSVHGSAVLRPSQAANCTPCLHTPPPHTHNPTQPNRCRAGRDLYSALGLKSQAGGGRLFGWERRGRRLLWELAKALNYLHSRNIVHLDM